MRHLDRGGGESAPLTSRCHAPYEDVRIIEVGEETDPIAKGRSTTEPARGIDRYDRHPMPSFPKGSDQATDKAALSGSGRTCDSQALGTARFGIETVDYFSARFAAALDDGQNPGEGTSVACERSVDKSQR